MSGKNNRVSASPTTSKRQALFQAGGAALPGRPARFNQQIARIPELIRQLRTRPWRDGFIIGASGASARKDLADFLGSHAREPRTARSIRVPNG
jgi:hypothetical protein